MPICSGWTSTTFRTGSTPTHTSCTRIGYAGAGSLRSSHTSCVTCRQHPMLRCTVQARSVHMWDDASKSAEEDRVFHYQMPTLERHFGLGLSSPHMLQQAAQLGHGRPLFMDATFGMNEHKSRSLRSAALRNMCCVRRLRQR